jgi:hypothetical protein
MLTTDFVARLTEKTIFHSEYADNDAKAQNLAGKF